MLGYYDSAIKAGLISSAIVGLLCLLVIAGPRGCVGGPVTTPTPQGAQGPVTPVNGSLMAPGVVVDCSEVPCASPPAPAVVPEAGEPLGLVGGD